MLAMLNAWFISHTYQSVFSVQMKNCDPFELGPLLAIDNVPAKNNTITIKLVGLYKYIPNYIPITKI